MKVTTDDCDLLWGSFVLLYLSASRSLQLQAVFSPLAVLSALLPPCLPVSRYAATPTNQVSGCHTFVGMYVRVENGRPTDIWRVFLLSLASFW